MCAFAMLPRILQSKVWNLPCKLGKFSLANLSDSHYSSHSNLQQDGKYDQLIDVILRTKRTHTSSTSDTEKNTLSNEVCNSLLNATYKQMINKTATKEDAFENKQQTYNCIESLRNSKEISMHNINEAEGSTTKVHEYNVISIQPIREKEKLHQNTVPLEEKELKEIDLEYLKNIEEVPRSRKNNSSTPAVDSAEKPISLLALLKQVQERSNELERMHVERIQAEVATDEESCKKPTNFPQLAPPPILAPQPPRSPPLKGCPRPLKPTDNPRPKRNNLAKTDIPLSTANPKITLNKASHDDDVASMKALFKPLIEECGKDQNIDPDTLSTTMKERKFSDCFLACVFKKLGILNDEGVFDIEKGGELAKSYMKDEKHVEFVKDIQTHCSSVNDKEVGDGNKGCERAKLMYDCVAKRKKEFFN